MSSEAVRQRKIIKRLKELKWIAAKVEWSIDGFPDLIALRNGVTIFIETKTPEGKLRPLQEHRHKQLRNQGFQVFTLNQHKFLPDEFT